MVDIFIYLGNKRKIKTSDEIKYRGKYDAPARRRA